MKDSWKLKPFSLEDQDRALSLHREIGISLSIAKLLVQRGIGSVEEAKAFLAPSLRDLHDPYLMLGMREAIHRVESAITSGERIMVYGDYDVDGTTAVALVYRFLRDHLCPSNQIEYYIPDRYDEGYGVSYQGVDEAHRLGINLVIVLDCGIKAVGEIAYAKSLGIDFIICEHHPPGEALPPAVSILNPHQKGDQYPFKHLSGCGVGFKLLQGIVRHRKMDEELLYRYLDLLALSIPTDQVSLLGENRVLVYYGLQLLNSFPSLGLKELIQQINLKLGEIDIDSITFKIGPLLNASGRMLNGKETVALLVSQDRYTARKHYMRLREFNQQRQLKDKEVTQQALEQVMGNPSIEQQAIIILYDPSWHKGVLGIVASRLADHYNRPVVILTKNGNEITGSGRSRNHFNLYKAIEACQSLLTSFGGHKYASGMTMEEAKLDLFRSTLLQYASEQHDHLQTQVDQEVDLELPIEKITPQFCRELEQMKPWGTKNPLPVFVSHRLRDAGGSKLVGRTYNHLKLKVTDRYCRVSPINGIAMGQSWAADLVLSQQPFSLCYTLSKNTYYGNAFVQMQVKDIDG